MYKPYTASCCKNNSGSLLLFWGKQKEMRQRNNHKKLPMARWPLTPKLVRLSYLHYIVSTFSFDLGWGWRWGGELGNKFFCIHPPFHSERLSTQPAHHKILSGGEENAQDSRVKYEKGDFFFKEIPMAFIHVLTISAMHVSCRNYRAKRVKCRLCR